jgi:hypothetical protein
MSKSGSPASIIVGTSGASGERLGLVTASARSAPDFTCGSEVVIVSNIIVTWPPRRSLSAGALPLYGTWTMSTLAVVFRSSPDRCAPAPAPPEANWSCPGLAFAAAISSCTLL